MDIVKVTDTKKKLEVVNAAIADSHFENVCLDGSGFNNISMMQTRISDANLSDLEIDGAQLGGAFIHNIGMPPEGHPYYDPAAKQRPLRFEHCDLQNSRIANCDLRGVELMDCKMEGMKINGIAVDDLLLAYQKINTHHTIKH